MAKLAQPLRRLYLALTKKKASGCHNVNPSPQTITKTPTSSPTIISMDKPVEPFKGHLADYRFGHSEQEATGPDYAQILAENEALEAQLRAAGKLK